MLSLRDLPVFEDALPTKLLEYMAAGRPVVASAAGDVARLLERSGAGIACAPGDTAALAAGIRALIRDPLRARAMGTNGARHVREHYSRDAFVDTLERLAVALAGDEREHARIRRVYGAYAASPARRRAWSPANPGNQRILGALYERVRLTLLATGNFPRDGAVVLTWAAVMATCWDGFASAAAPEIACTASTSSASAYSPRANASTGRSLR